MPTNDSPAPTPPDYKALVHHLVAPLLEHPEGLKVSCEFSQGKQRTLVRMSLGDNDQGRVLGRGSRNLEAMRTVLNAAARAVNQTARLEVFELHRAEIERSSRTGGDRPRNQRARPRKPAPPRKP
ncbi:MAG: KH domain-containing protein [Spirulinaceae cyanobacterium]